MQKTITGLLIAALCILSFASIVGMAENSVKTAAPITIDDALLTARKYMMENRIFAGNYQITSAILHDQPEGTKVYWEITLRRNPEVTKVTLMILRVNMDKSVERSVTMKPEMK